MSQHDLVVLGGVAGPVDVGAQPRGVALELLQVVGQPGDRVQLDLRGQFAQLLPFGHGLRRLVAFGAHEPQRLIVPVRPFAVGDELRGVDRGDCPWSCRHESHSNPVSASAVAAFGRNADGCVA